MKFTELELIQQTLDHGFTVVTILLGIVILLMISNAARRK